MCLNFKMLKLIGTSKIDDPKFLNRKVGQVANKIKPKQSKNVSVFNFCLFLLILNLRLE